MPLEEPLVEKHRLFLEEPRPGVREELLDGISYRGDGPGDAAGDLPLSDGGLPGVPVREIEGSAHELAGQGALHPERAVAAAVGTGVIRASFGVSAVQAQHVALHSGEHEYVLSTRPNRCFLNYCRN